MTHVFSLTLNDCFRFETLGDPPVCQSPLNYSFQQIGGWNRKPDSDEQLVQIKHKCFLIVGFKMMTQRDDQETDENIGSMVR